MKPASVTVCEDSNVSPGVEGTLSSPELAGKLFPVVPAGLLLPVGPVGLYGMKSPSDLEPVSPDGPYTGPVGLFGKLSPFFPDPADPVGQHVAGGPVGPFGTLSPLDSDPAGPVGPYVAGGPVGPCDSDSFGPVGLCGTLSPSASELAILVDPGGMFPSSEDGPGLCPIGLTGGLSPAMVAPLPAEGDPTITMLPVEGLERNYAEIGEESIAVHDVWSYPDVDRTPAVIATVGLIAGPAADDDTVDCADECAAWDSGYQREIIDGVTVYYGGDLCDSEESDWEDQFDIAGREYVDHYNFDLLEGMGPMVFAPGGDPSRSDMRDDVGTGLAHVCQTTVYGTQGVLERWMLWQTPSDRKFLGLPWGFLWIFAVATEFFRTGLIGMEREMSEVWTIDRLRIVK